MFNTASTRETSAGNRVNDAVPRRGTINLHSDSRWQTQMVFSETVYSFVVEEDTAPG